MSDNKEYITISKETWVELKSNPIFEELIEIIEDREDLLREKEKKTPKVTLKEYDNKRRKKKL